MSLRGRLAVLFAVTAVGYVALATAALRMQTTHDLRVHAETELAAIRAISAETVDAARDRASDLASDLQTLASRDPAGAPRWLPQTFGPPGAERADAAVVTDVHGRVLAAASSPPAFTGELGHEPEELVEAARERRVLPGVLLEVRDSAAGSVVVGVWTDQDLLARLPVGAAIVAGGRVVASRDDTVPSGPLPPDGRMVVSRWEGQRVLVTSERLVPGPARRAGTGIRS